MRIASFLIVFIATACTRANEPIEVNTYVQGSLGEELIEGDLKIQEGHYRVSLPGRAPRDFQVRLLHRIVRGIGDTEMELTDTTDQTVTTLALQDEQAEGVLTAPDGLAVSATYNEDESISVGENSYATPEDAADVLFTAPESEAVTPESLAVASAVLGDDEEDTGSSTDRGFVKKAVKWVWKKILNNGICIKTTIYTDGSYKVGGCKSE